MTENRKRRGVLFKAIAMAVVCLFTLNNLVWANPDLFQSTPKFNLAAASIFWDQAFLPQAEHAALSITQGIQKPLSKMDERPPVKFEVRSSQTGKKIEVTGILCYDEKWEENGLLVVPFRFSAGKLEAVFTPDKGLVEIRKATADKPTPADGADDIPKGGMVGPVNVENMIRNAPATEEGLRPIAQIIAGDIKDWRKEDPALRQIFHDMLDGLSKESPELAAKCRILAEQVAESEKTVSRMPLEPEATLDGLPEQREIIKSGKPLEFGPGLLYHGRDGLDEAILNNSISGEIPLGRTAHFEAARDFKNTSQSPAIFVIPAALFNSLMDKGKAALRIPDDRSRGVIDPYPEIKGPLSLDALEEIWTDMDTYERYERIVQNPSTDREKTLKPKIEALFKTGKIKVIPGLIHTTTDDKRLAGTAVGKYVMKRGLLEQIPLFKERTPAAELKAALMPLRHQLLECLGSRGEYVHPGGELLFEKVIDEASMKTKIVGRFYYPRTKRDLYITFNTKRYPVKFKDPSGFGKPQKIRNGILVGVESKGEMQWLTLARFITKKRVGISLTRRNQYAKNMHESPYKLEIGGWIYAEGGKPDIDLSPHIVLFFDRNGDFEESGLYEEHYPEKAAKDALLCGFHMHASGRYCHWLSSLDLEAVDSRVELGEPPVEIVFDEKGTGRAFFLKKNVDLTELIKLMRSFSAANVSCTEKEKNDFFMQHAHRFFDMYDIVLGCDGVEIYHTVTPADGADENKTPLSGFAVMAPGVAIGTLGYVILGAFIYLYLSSQKQAIIDWLHTKGYRRLEKLANILLLNLSKYKIPFFTKSPQLAGTGIKVPAMFMEGKSDEKDDNRRPTTDENAAGAEQEGHFVDVRAAIDRALDLSELKDDAVSGIDIFIDENIPKTIRVASYRFETSLSIALASLIKNVKGLRSPSMKAFMQDENLVFEIADKDKGIDLEKLEAILRKNINDGRVAINDKGNLFIAKTPTVAEGWVEKGMSRRIAHIEDVEQLIRDKGKYELPFMPYLTSKESSRQRRHGIGLCMARGYIRECGGDLTYTTGPQGTTFTVNMPLTAAGTKDTPARRVFYLLLLPAITITLSVLFGNHYVILLAASPVLGFLVKIFIGGLSRAGGSFISQTAQGVPIDRSKIIRWFITGSTVTGPITLVLWFWILANYVESVFWRVALDIVPYAIFVTLPLSFLIQKYFIYPGSGEIEFKKTVHDFFRIFIYNTAYWCAVLSLGWTYWPEKIVLIAANAGLIAAAMRIYLLDHWIKHAETTPDVDTTSDIRPTTDENTAYTWVNGELLQLEGGGGIWITGDFGSGKSLLAKKIIENNERYKIVSCGASFIKLDDTAGEKILLGRRKSENDVLLSRLLGKIKVELSRDSIVRVRWIIALDDTCDDFLKNILRSGLTAEELGIRVIRVADLDIGREWKEALKRINDTIEAHADASTEPDIFKKAHEVIGSETDDYRKAEKVFNWVRENMTYRLDLTWDVPASEVLEKGYGHCANLSELTAKLLRAVGIPVRIVIEHTNKGSYQYFTMPKVYSIMGKNGDRSIRHVCAEAFIGGKWCKLDYLLSEVITKREELEVQDIDEEIVYEFDSWLEKHPPSAKEAKTRKRLTEQFYRYHFPHWDGRYRTIREVQELYSSIESAKVASKHTGKRANGQTGKRANGQTDTPAAGAEAEKPEVPDFGPKEALVPHSKARREYSRQKLQEWIAAAANPLLKRVKEKITANLRYVSQEEFENRLKVMTEALNKHLADTPSYGVVFDFKPHGSMRWVYELVRPYLSKQPDLTVYHSGRDDARGFKRSIRDVPAVVLFDDQICSGAHTECIMRDIGKDKVIFVVAPYISAGAHEMLQTRIDEGYKIVLLKDEQGRPAYEITRDFYELFSEEEEDAIMNDAELKELYVTMSNGIKNLVYFDHKLPDQQAWPWGLSRILGMQEGGEPYKEKGSKYYEMEEEEFLLIKMLEMIDFYPKYLGEDITRALRTHFWTLRAEILYPECYRADDELINLRTTRAVQIFSEIYERIPADDPDPIGFIKNKLQSRITRIRQAWKEAVFSSAAGAEEEKAIAEPRYNIEEIAGQVLKDIEVTPNLRHGIVKINIADDVSGKTFLTKKQYDTLGVMIFYLLENAIQADPSLIRVNFMVKNDRLFISIADIGKGIPLKALKRQLLELTEQGMVVKGKTGFLMGTKIPDPKNPPVSKQEVVNFMENNEKWIPFIACLSTKGNGWGLATVMTCLEMLDGSIDYVTGPSGTIFTVSIPLATSGAVRDLAKLEAGARGMTFKEILASKLYSRENVLSVKGILEHYSIDKSRAFSDVLRDRNIKPYVKWKLHQILIDEFIKSFYTPGEANNGKRHHYGEAIGEYEDFAKIKTFFEDILQVERPWQILTRLLKGNQLGGNARGRQLNVLEVGDRKTIFDAHASSTFGINILSSCSDTGGSLVHEAMALSGSTDDKFNEQVEEAYKKWRVSGDISGTPAIKERIERIRRKSDEKLSGPRLPDITDLDVDGCLLYSPGEMPEVFLSMEELIGEVQPLIEKIEVEGSDVSSEPAVVEDEFFGSVVLKSAETRRAEENIAKLTPCIIATCGSGNEQLRNKAKEYLIHIFNNCAAIDLNAVLLEFHRQGVSIPRDLKRAFDESFIRREHQRCGDARLVIAGNEKRELDRIFKYASIFAQRAVYFDVIQQTNLAGQAYKEAYRLFRIYLEKIATVMREELTAGRAPHLEILQPENANALEWIGALMMRLVDNEERFKALGIEPDDVDRKYIRVFREIENFDPLYAASEKLKREDPERFREEFMSRREAVLRAESVFFNAILLSSSEERDWAKADKDDSASGVSAPKSPRKKHTKFNLEHVVRCIIDIFAKAPNRRNMPNMRKIAVAAGLSQGTIWNYRKQILERLEEKADELGDKRIKTAVSFYRRPPQAVADYIFKLFKNNPNQKGLPPKSKIAKAFGFKSKPITKCFPRALELLEEKADELEEKEVAERIKRAVAFHRDMVEAIVQYILDSFKKDPERKKIPHFKEIASAFGFKDLGTISRHLEKIMDRLREEKDARVQTAAKLYTDREEAIIDLVKQYIIKLFAEDPKRETLPSLVELARVIGIRWYTMSACLGRISENLRKVSDTRIRRAIELRSHPKPNPKPKAQPKRALSPAKPKPKPKPEKPARNTKERASTVMRQVRALSRNPYKLLGVSSDATTEEIKRKYHRLALQHHPDKNGNSGAAMKELNEAYEILTDPDKRKICDGLIKARFSRLYMEGCIRKLDSLPKAELVPNRSRTSRTILLSKAEVAELLGCDPDHLSLLIAKINKVLSEQGLNPFKTAPRHRLGTPAAGAEKTYTEHDTNVLRDLLDEEELPKCLREMLIGLNYNNKVVFAFDEKLAEGRDGKPFQSFLKALENLKRNPKYEKILRNLVVIPASVEELPSLLEEYAGKKNTKVFTFARKIQEAQDALKDIGNVEGVQTVFIDENGIPQTAYYPLAEIVTIALAQVFAPDIISAENIRSLIEGKLQIDLAQLNIESVRREGKAIIFTLLPDAEELNYQDLIQRYAKLKRFLKAA